MQYEDKCTQTRTICQQCLEATTMLTKHIYGLINMIVQPLSHTRPKNNININKALKENNNEINPMQVWAHKFFSCMLSTLYLQGLLKSNRLDINDALV